MNITNETTDEFFRGRPCVHVDGDTAAQKERTASCLGACSINVSGVALSPVKSPDSVPKNGLGTLPPNETISYNMRENPETNKNPDKANEHHENKEESTRTRARMNYKLNEIADKRHKIWKGIGKRQGIKIGSLNINGKRDEMKKDKWPKLAKLIRSQGIAILGIQESHLENDEVETLQERFQNLIVLNNGVSTSKGGVTFILNKEKVNGMKWTHIPLLEGRVSRLEIEIEQERGINIILVYAPNENKEKSAFWKRMKNKLKEIDNMENIVIMGDFNSVEEALDRYPHREEDAKVERAWSKVRKQLKLIDGWRLHNPLDKEYTHVHKATGSMSRIDRIYLDKGIYPYSYNWGHEETGISDHSMVTVEILRKNLPFIGKGVWRMYQDDIDNERTIKRITELLSETNENMNNAKEKRANNNKSIQRIWMETKEKIKAITIEERKTRESHLKRAKRKLKKGIAVRLEKLTEEMNETNLKYHREILEMKTELKMTMRNDLTKMQIATRANYRQKGEKCTKYWFNLKKEKMQENVILALVDKDNKITEDTRKMGEIAVQHHERLQARPEMTEERIAKIKELENTIEGKTIDEEQKTMLNEKTSRIEIEEAIKKTANGTSPGTDGIPYELYKKIKEREEKKKEGVDIIGILHKVIEEIEEKGIETMSAEKKEKEFTDGLMFLLYKKKEKSKIENYRPITLLNTDYKIYTKTIAKRLAVIAPKIINEDQAGFIPKRSLYDHTRTTQMIVEYCEVTEKDGCIVALDQEKAYDKIDHDYLWIILKKYGLPETFINRIKEMYKNTSKAIMINGIVTRKYEVKRGVHQGDPMSCVLYDIAIEPLAEALRKSSLKGIDVKGSTERLLVNLFADDTLVYLRKSDDMTMLERVIGIFCTASTAKFNMDKTEILPIGGKEFRQKMIEERKMGNNIITNDKRIIKEGESMRTLGSWVGNGKNDMTQWNKILRSQEKILEVWSKVNLTLQGKELVLKSLVQSKAVFLATVNGMPKSVEKEMQRMYHTFMWNGKPKGLIKWEQALVEKSKGGLGVPDIAARIEAIEIMWLKKWLSVDATRPKWALIMDMIINESIAKQPIIDEESRMNWIIQTWHESEAKEVRLSSNIRRILRVARKYNITPIAPKYDTRAKENMPLWHNIMMRDANYQWNKKSARCLRQKHNIRTIGDLIDWKERKNCSKACNEMTDRIIDMIPDKINPIKETPRKVKRMNLDLTPNRIKVNIENEKIHIFNPDITTRMEWKGAIRLFSKEKGPKTRRIDDDPRELHIAYRDQSSNKKMKAKLTLAVMNRKKINEKTRVGINIVTKEISKEETIVFDVKSDTQSADKARALALITILKKAKNRKLSIATDDGKINQWIGKKLNKAEDDNWLGIRNVELWKEVLRRLRKRGNVTKIKTIDKDTKTKETLNDIKDDMKKRNNVRELNHRPKKEDEFNIKGAKLDKMTQKKAYELIVLSKGEIPGGARTSSNIEKIKEALAEKDKKIQDEDIWNGLKSIYSPHIKDFLWKVIHGRVKCGPFFRFIPNWSEKEFCTCGESETIEHILLKCKESGQEELWNIVRTKWKQETGEDMMALSMGVIMGIGCIEIPKTWILERTAKTSLFRKLVLLTVWIIWKERNDRIFNEKDVLPQRLIAKWEREIKREIKIDLWEKVNKKVRERNKAMWTLKGAFAEIEITEDKKEIVRIK